MGFNLLYVWSAAFVENDSIGGLGIFYDSTLAGKVTITKFVLDNYSADYTNGVFAGTFEFTLWNPDLNDTIYITNGQFCIPTY